MIPQIDFLIPCHRLKVLRQYLTVQGSKSYGSNISKDEVVDQPETASVKVLEELDIIAVPYLFQGNKLQREEMAQKKMKLLSRQTLVDINPQEKHQKYSQLNHPRRLA